MTNLIVRFTFETGSTLSTGKYITRRNYNERHFQTDFYFFIGKWWINAQCSMLNAQRSPLNAQCPTLIAPRPKCFALIPCVLLFFVPLISLKLFEHIL